MASSSSAAASALPLAVTSITPGAEYGYRWEPAAWPAGAQGGATSKEDAAFASAAPVRGEDPTFRGPRMAKWSPDGTMLAVAGEDNNVRVFKLQQNGALVRWRSLTGHSAPVRAVAWAQTKTSCTCFTAGTDSTVQVWDLTAGRSAGNFGTRPRVIYLATSVDGRYFSAGTLDNVVSVYDAVSRRVVSCTQMPNEMNAQLWTPSGELVIASATTGGGGGSLCRFALADDASDPAFSGKQAVPVRLGTAGCGLKLVSETRVLAGAARVLADSLSHRALAVGGVDSCVAVMDAETEACVRTVDAGTGAVTAAEFSHDGRFLALAARDQAVRIVRVADGVTVRELSETVARCVALSWNPERLALAVLCGDDASPARLLTYFGDAP
ncbi:hypothetical protein FNF27_00460 [Cafeteria roenbergensis]|uniref:Uncharacterized protein n=1 Tax=Cafeteria roenbergensis TaxID=33653 RepID=A0A5A8EKB2_CAFRO|nr:hypothetical protein FNF27_00460 [Cafeteria roenbergensis]